MHRSGLRRWLSLSIALALLTAALWIGPSASAAASPFTAWGTLHCTMSGTHTMKPGLTNAVKAGVVQGFKAKLTCTTGTTGRSTVTVKTGRITATSAAATLSCSSTALPVVNASIKWTAKGGRINPTYLQWNGATTSTSPRTTKHYPTASYVTGSYAGGAATAVVISDVVGQAGCVAKAGMKTFKFTGLGGASTFNIPSSPSSAILLFGDEFNGTSLSLSNWRPNWTGTTDAQITKPVNTAEQGCYDPAQVSVSGGSLHLKAVARSCTATNGVTYPYASGLVSSRNDFTFTYGYMEARIYTPPGAGPIQNWPAFWADGTGTHPVTGELDVFEGIGGKACWHFHYSGGEPGSCAAGANPAGWHVYGADWRPGSVTYFYDGVQVGVITTGITKAPMFVILNLGLSSSVSGPVTVPSEMLVDWVHVTS